MILCRVEYSNSNESQPCNRVYSIRSNGTSRRAIHDSISAVLELLTISMKEKWAVRCNFYRSTPIKVCSCNLLCMYVLVYIIHPLVYISLPCTFVPHRVLKQHEADQLGSVMSASCVFHQCSPPTYSLYNGVYGGGVFLVCICTTCTTTCTTIFVHVINHYACSCTPHFLYTYAPPLLPCTSSSSSSSHTVKNTIMC